MYVIVTNHAKERIAERTNRTLDQAEAFAIWMFGILYKHYKKKEKYKDREVKIFSAREWKQKITDWKHKFVYARWLWEVTILTYSKKTDTDKLIQRLTCN